MLVIKQFGPVTYAMGTLQEILAGTGIAAKVRALPNDVAGCTLEMGTDGLWTGASVGTLTQVQADALVASGAMANVKVGTPGNVAGTLVCYGGVGAGWVRASDIGPGSPSTPFTTIAERTAWATQNLAALLPGRTTVWGPGNVEYVWNGPLAHHWACKSAPSSGITLFVGDSITLRNWDVLSGKNSENLVHEGNMLLDGAERWVNAGVGGNTLQDMINRFDSVIASINDPIYAIHIEGGTNGGTNDDLRELIKRAKSITPLVFVASLFPSGCTEISTPAIVSASQVAGGTLPAGTYSYTVTAQNAIGSTVASVAAGITTNATASVNLVLGFTPGANKYKIFRGGLYIGKLDASNAGGAPIVFADTGFSTTAETPAASNTTGSPSSLGKLSVNLGYAKICTDEAVEFIDYYSQVVNKQTGCWVVGGSYDATHPTFYSGYLIGRFRADKMRKIYTSLPQDYPLSFASESSLFPNPMLASATSSAIKPDNWAVTGESSLSTDSDGYNVFTLAPSKLAPASAYNSAATVAINAGDVLLLTCLAKGDNNSAPIGSVIQLKASYFDAYHFLYAPEIHGGTEWKCVCRRIVVPQTGTMSIVLLANRGASLAVKRLSVINLTALGLT